jgi:bacteroidetes-specific putative membrane protein
MKQALLRRLCDCAQRFVLRGGAHLVFILIGYSGLSAQEYPQIRQWQEALPYFNPAAIARTESQHLMGLYSYAERWSKLYAVMTDLPVSFLGRSHGVGGQVIGRTRGLFTDTEFSVRYAWLQSLPRGGRIQVGLEGGLSRITFDGARAIAEGIMNAELPTTKVEGKAFDLGVGLLWEQQCFSLGLSAQHLFASKVSFSDRYQVHLPRSYTASLSLYLGRVETGLSWRPSLLARYHDESGYRIDMGLGAWWRNRFTAGLIYRWGRALGVQLGATIGGIFLGYQGECITRRERQYQHELLLRYNLPLTRSTNKPTHYKSVRLL